MRTRWVGAVATLVVVAGSVAACGGDPPAGAADLTVAGSRVHAIDRSPSSHPTGIVLFLHGAAYTSADWDRLGLIDDVVHAGWRAVAIDLPGKGDSSRRRSRRPTSSGPWWTSSASRR